LQEIYVTAAGNIEGMALWTKNPARFLSKDCVAVSDSAKECGPGLQLTIMQE
jgi:hypothetical protein